MTFNSSDAKLGTQNRILYFGFFFFLILNFSAQAQFRDDQSISNNLTEIKSINPLDNEFTGYEILAKKIGNARIVMLGEQTHGHGTTLTAKTKIVKYLVENLGFDVIVFESSFYEINKLWDSDLAFSKKIDSTRREVYGIWSNREEMTLFFDYLKERNSRGTRLDLSGIDCKHQMPYGQKNYVTDFDEFLIKYKIKTPSEYSKFKILLSGLILGDINSKASPEEIVLFNSTLEMIELEMRQLHASDEVDFWGQELRSLKKQARSCWVLSKTKGTSRFTARDSAMAENLIWLADHKLNGRKIIVWAASYHIAKRKEYFEGSKHFDTDNLEIMGDIVNKKLPNQVYTLGFISSEGSYSEFYSKGSPSYPIKRSSTSFEALVAKTPYNYAFIDMKNFNNESYFNMAGIDYFETRAVWNKIFDGLFYIRKMAPPTHIKK